MSNDGNTRSYGIATRAIHAGNEVDIGAAIPTVAPLHLASAFFYRSSADLDQAFVDPETNYAYARFGNPTVRQLESVVAALEGADACIAWPSGMAAINGIFSTFLQPGDTVAVSRDVYGATGGLLTGQFTANGITAQFIDVEQLEDVTDLVQHHRPRMIYAETISNPLLKVADIARLREIASLVDAMLVIDNTFASPSICRPLEHGADLVLHSSTKYLGGHGDVLGGVVSGNRELITAMRNRARINGSVPGAFDAWLTIRGIKTLDLRMREHSANARRVADWLERDPRIERVYYPCATGTPLDRQFVSDDRGGLLSFDVHGLNGDRAYRMLESYELIESAPTLGDVGSVSLYPARSSHRGLSQEQRDAWGIRDTLMRISVGIENVDDIIADIDQALTRALGEKEATSA